MTDDFIRLIVQEKALKLHIEKLSESEQVLVLKALKLAKRAHEKQMRDDGTQYVIHPIRICLSLCEFKKATPERMCAALLHDVVEDTGISLDLIREQFGKRVATLVRNLTRIRPLEETEDQKKSSKIKKLKSYLTADYDTRIIKCADVLDNVRSWSYIPLKHPSRLKFNRWYTEVERYSLPIADQTDALFADLLRQAFQRAQSQLA